MSHLSDTFEDGNVITAEAAASLRRYKYSGADKSLLYKYVLSPLAEQCVMLLPSWMAPNLVTTIGLGFTTASYLLLYAMAPRMKSEDTPAWVFPVAGAALFAYQTLDNMDGKQARRTGSSSPLGLVFDHGCDAINCCFGVVFVGCILSAGSNVMLLSAIFLNQVVPFFFTTWEHYYTEELILPILNGPSEGVELGIISACLRGYYGPQLFTEPREALYGFALGEALVAGSLIGVAITLTKQFFMVAKSRSESSKTLQSPAEDASGFGCLLVFSGIWACYRPQLFLEAPYMMVLLLGFLHVDIVVHLMVCHMCDMRCRAMRPILIPFVFVWANSFVPGGPLLNEVALVWCFTALVLIYEALYLYMVVTETSEALDIFVFKLGKRSSSDGREDSTKKLS